jgi:hypothetical protein
MLTTFYQEVFIPLVKLLQQPGLLQVSTEIQKLVNFVLKLEPYFLLIMVFVVSMNLTKWTQKIE